MGEFYETERAECNSEAYCFCVLGENNINVATALGTASQQYFLFCEEGTDILLAKQIKFAEVETGGK